MKIIKRDGTQEEVKFDKVLKRVSAQSKGLKLDPAYIAQKVVGQLRDGISSSEVDKLLSESSAVLTDKHPDYSTLAARIAITTLHKETEDFYQTMKKLSKAKDDVSMGKDFMKLVKEHGKDLEEYIDYQRDFLIDYFGFEVLSKSYLLKIDGKITERPQHLYMRVALEIGGQDLERVKQTYDLLSKQYYTHATPTLFNSGLEYNQLSSCFLVAAEDDSIKGIFNTLSECADISKMAGGIGLHIHNVRATGSKIRGTNGTSNGIIPMLKVFNETARYVDQGGGKRKGSFAIYLEPWHLDIEDFLDLKKPTGNDERRARDLFLAMYVPNLFMERVQSDGDWTLFCPSDVKDLPDLYDDGDQKNFTKAYIEYEKKGVGQKTMKAKDLLKKIIEAQVESGVPYVVYKDHVNAKCNQKNLGTIKSSNLCVEITEYSDANETAVCNLASLSLPKFLKDKKDGTTSFDYKRFGEVVEMAIENLNLVIDRNYYPTAKAKFSNMKHRPLGLGWQGLADVFLRMKMSFGTPEALALDRKIAEHTYYHALRASNRIAQRDGAYESFEGSPASKGLLQYDLWSESASLDLDWEGLKKDIKKHGLRNSLLVAMMPTASTASIFGNEASFEPIPFVIGKREVLAGEFFVVNRHLIKELEELDLWNDQMRDKILQGGGSVQNIEEIPKEMRDRYRISREYSQRVLIDHAAIRAPFVCQSQSMNLFWDSDISFSKLYSALMHGWKKGLKTGSYYMRSRSKMEARLVTVKKVKDVKKVEPELTGVCAIDSPEDCEACGS